MRYPRQLSTGVMGLASHRTVRRIIASVLLSVSLNLTATEPNTSEYEVKAAFLYNFAKFVEWPAEALGDANQTFNICFAGDKSIGQDLQQVVSGKSITNHAIRIIQVHTPAESRICHILFLTSETFSEESHFLALLRDASVLTVGETKGFCNRGGIINFWIDSEHVRFEISPKASQRAHLLASSRLLRLARVVGPPAEGGGSQ